MFGTAGDYLLHPSALPSLIFCWSATPQFAYNEVSFFLIRLFQKFSGFTLAKDAQPEDTYPPAEWSTYSGDKGTTKIWPTAHLTMYVKVKYPAFIPREVVLNALRNQGGLWVRMEAVDA